MIAVAALTLGIAIACGLPVAHTLRASSEQFQDPSSQYERANAAIASATGRTPYFGVYVLLRSDSPIPGRQPALRAETYLISLLSHQRGFQGSMQHSAARAPKLLSRDKRETAVLAAFATPAESVAAVSHTRARMGSPAARALIAGAQIRFGGPDLTFDELDRRTVADLQRVELLALPVLALIAFWVFGGIVAAVLPLLVAGLAILLSFAALRLLDQATGISVFALNVVSGLGLGLGIDYSLLMVRRFREELARRRDVRAAVAGTLQTAGRTVILSALSVSTALLALLVFPLQFLRSMGIGGALTAFSAGMVAVTLLPAALVVLGHNVDAFAPPRLAAGRSSSNSTSQAWRRIAANVMRRPTLTATATCVALLIVAAPAMHLRLTAPSANLLPASAESRLVEARLAKDFAPNPAATATVVLPGSSAAGSSAGSRKRFDRMLGSLARGRADIGTPSYLGAGTWEITLALPGSPYASANLRLIERIGLHARTAGALVGGLSAFFIDQRAAIASHLPLALVLLALVTSGFLFIISGSLILPVKAFAMNLLTAAAGAGLLVVIFQEGHLAGLLGFTPVGGLEESNLIFLLVVAFALSTDYEVLLLSRIKESRDSGLQNTDAIAAGLQGSGGLITAAALLFCVAVGAFATSELFYVKQFGVGAALTVAIDASVVRVLLVPALMALLGDWNWWSPRPLRRLHRRIGMTESALSASAGARIASDMPGRSS